MSYEEAKELHAQGHKVYRAYYYGRIGSAGGIIDASDTISYSPTKAEALNECKLYKMFDFDKRHIKTYVELCGSGEFDE